MSIQITIDERPLDVEKGSTILQAARQHEIYIPTLCDFPGLPSHGSCRMCIVEIQGRPNTPTACTTPVENGMVIQTNSQKVQNLRGELLQLLLSEHPSSCLFCPEKSHCDECMVTLRKAGVTTGCRSCAKDGQCDLQTMVEKVGLPQVGYPTRYRMLPVEKYDPFFDRDYNLCVLCGRCIRACNELHFTNSLAYTQRGTETVVGTAFGRTHMEAGCSFCGSCVEVCPTGSLSEKTRKWDGKADGAISTTCPLCSIGCQIKLETKNGIVIGSLPDHAAGSEFLCVKGRFGITELVNHPTRLKNPARSVARNSLKISWDEAIRAAAQKLAACPPDQFEMVISASCTNEDFYIAHKFAKEVMKIDRILMPALDRYVQGLPEVIDLLNKSQPLSILDEATSILCFGLDAQYAQSVVEIRLHRAVRRGARLINIYPFENNLGLASAEWLQPALGEETRLIQTLMSAIQPQAVPNIDGPIQRTAEYLRNDPSPVFIVGPTFLTHPDNRSLLQALENLIALTHARVIVLPAEGNLAGVLRIGAASLIREDAGSKSRVIYLIGEDIPEGLTGDEFILYQNIYPPSSGQVPDLTLPAAAFSEENGTFVNYSGQIQEIRQVVSPPGEALPSWEILCRIARQMGAPGFDYSSAAEIRTEIALNLENRINSPAALQNGAEEDQHAIFAAANSQSSRSNDHIYMGFPLTHWVAGLRMLVSDEAVIGQPDFTASEKA